MKSQAELQEYYGVILDGIRLGNTNSWFSATAHAIGWALGMTDGEIERDIANARGGGEGPPDDGPPDE